MKNLVRRPLPQFSDLRLKFVAVPRAAQRPIHASLAEIRRAVRAVATERWS